MGFTKLDENILMSSIMTEEPAVFKIWIALLAACKEDGIARVSAVGLSSHCFLPIEVVRAAIERLSSPDADSRSINDEGKRIERVDGGYYIINYHKYRELSYRESEAKRKYLSRTCPDKSGNVQELPDISASVSLSSSLPLKGDARGKVEYSSEFLSFWSSYPKKVGKGAAWKEWQRERPPIETCLKTLEWQKKSTDWTKEGGKYIVDPERWIKRRRWEDEPTGGTSTQPARMFHG